MTRRSTLSLSAATVAAVAVGFAVTVSHRGGAASARNAVPAAATTVGTRVATSQAVAAAAQVTVSGTVSRGGQAQAEREVVLLRPTVESDVVVRGLREQITEFGNFVAFSRKHARDMERDAARFHRAGRTEEAAKFAAFASNARASADEAEAEVARLQAALRQDRGERTAVATAHEATQSRRGFAGVLEAARVRSEVTGPDGAFTFQDVPAGHYAVFAYGGSEGASGSWLVPVEAGGDAVTCRLDDANFIKSKRPKTGDAK